MKTFIYTTLLILTIGLGCKSSAQKIAGNTIYSIDKVAVTSYDAYLSLVIKGSLPTNDVPKVSKAFNQFQAAVTIAYDGVQYNTNALAPSALVQESTDLITLINSVTHK